MMAIPEFDGPALDALAKAVARALSDQRAKDESSSRKESTANRLIATLAGIIGIVSLIFSLGVNWSKVASNAHDTELLASRVDSTERSIGALRQEMNVGTLTVQRQLGDILSQLGEIRGALSSSSENRGSRTAHPVFPSTPTGIQ